MYSLFDVECSHCDPMWRQVRDEVTPRHAEVKNKLKALWETYKQYGDKNFRQEFARHTHQRFWEMYLACHLLEQGKTLVPKDDRDQSGPDILIEEAGSRIWIEAVAPTSGATDNPDQVRPMLVDAEVHNVPVGQLLLRVTSQLRDKNAKFLQYLRKGIVAQDDLCIIGISCGDMKGFEDLSASYINNAFYPRNRAEKPWLGREISAVKPRRTESGTIAVRAGPRRKWP